MSATTGCVVVLVDVQVRGFSKGLDENLHINGLIGEVYGNHGVYHESFSCKKTKEYRGMGQHDPGWWYIEGWFLSSCATLPKYLDGQCRQVRFEFLSVSGSLHCYVDYPIMQCLYIESGCLFPYLDMLGSG